MNRRGFIRAGSAAATAAFAATPGVSFSQVIGGGAPFDDYRALVCVFLFGGNDSYNMLVPRSDAEYNVVRDVEAEPRYCAGSVVADQPIDL